jgi:uncharacterized membrane protein
MMDLKKTCTLLYIAYVLGAVVQVSPLGALVGSSVIIAAVCVAYAKRDKAKDTPYESHLIWLRRTFWIGGGVYLPVLTLIGSAFVYVRMDFPGLAQKMMNQGAPDALESGDPAQVEAMGLKFMDVLTSEYGHLMRMTTLAVSAPFLIWWFWRCWKGYVALKAGRPVDKVESWL